MPQVKVYARINIKMVMGHRNSDQISLFNRFLRFSVNLSETKITNILVGWLHLTLERIKGYIVYV